MLFTLKKKPDATISAENVKRDETPLSDFIPYYCHYNSHTLLTKNGELLQVIKISSNTLGLNYESGEGAGNTLRELIRKAVTESIGSDHFSLWTHTIRKRRPIEFSSSYDNPFAAYVHEQWRKKHRWKYQYQNEVYITVLREGQSCDLFNSAHFKNAFLPRLNRDFRNRYLDAMHKDLEETVSKMLHILRSHYNAHRLGIVERIPDDMPQVRQPVFYSEPLEFLGTLVNLAGTPQLLPEADLSKALNTHAITFGYNALETKDASGHRHFGALLSLKHYQEAPAETIDRVLQSSVEMIVSQSFGFINYRHAIKKYKAQKDVFDISGDAYSANVTGLTELLGSHQKRPIDFGEQQTSITIIVEDYKQLEHDVLATQKMFGELGMVTVREDIRLEEGFWAQLPGNFEFIRRKDIVPTSKIAGFSRLNRFPTGMNAGTHWQEATTIIPTRVGSPFFFNFHHQDNGHTLLFDFNSFNDHSGRILMQFLVTSATKYDGRIFVFDRHNAARLLFNKLGAPYHRIGLPPALQFNPFSLEYNPRNVGFLIAWCGLLLAPRITLDALQKETLRQAIEQTFTISTRSMSSLVHTLSQSDTSLAAALAAAAQGLASYGLNEQDALDLSGNLLGFNFDAPIGSPPAGVALFSYLLHRIISDVDGRPTLIVLNDMIDLLENEFFAPRLESLLEMLTQNNVMVLFMVRNPQDYAETAPLQTLLKNCATKLYVPDEISLDYAVQGVGLSAQDSKSMGRMSREAGDFLCKQSGETIALRVNLDDQPDIKAIFSNDAKTLITAGGSFSSLPKEYW